MPNCPQFLTNEQVTVRGFRQAEFNQVQRAGPPTNSARSYYYLVSSNSTVTVAPIFHVSVYLHESALYRVP